jgi:hypothetical protein
MPVVNDFRVSPPQIHPEFGYFCPTPLTRRLVRVGLLAALGGLMLGAVGVVALTHSPPPTTVAQGTSESIKNDSDPTVRTAAAETPAPAGTATPCAQQAWPFVDRPCMRGSAGWQGGRAVPAPPPRPATAAAPVQTMTPAATVTPVPTLASVEPLQKAERGDITPPDVLDTPPKREKTAQSRKRSRHQARSRPRPELDSYARASRGQGQWNGWFW